MEPKKESNKLVMGKVIKPELDKSYFNSLAQLLNKKENLSEETKESLLKQYAETPDLKKEKDKVIKAILEVIDISFSGFMKMVNENVRSETKEDDTIYVSKIINEDIIAEQVYDGKNKYCVYNIKENKISYEEEIIIDGIPNKPIQGEEIVKGAVLLPSMAKEYGSDEELDNEIKKFVNFWLDIPPDVLQFAVWNIKRSWVYEKFHTLNYLRALGDTGMGKSRFLDVLGSIHYKPIYTGGATTPAPIFRIIDKWHGSLIMDEADFQQSDESQDIIKIINMGYEKGKFVIRCDQNNVSELNFFDPFCPKILATRKTFQDKAVESRCITQIMTGTIREDIPFSLDKSFFEKGLELRNKLLMWRFDNYNIISTVQSTKFDFGELEPRVKQIVNSFVSLFKNDENQIAAFKIFIRKHQEDIIDDRRNSFDGQIVTAINTLVVGGQFHINAQDIIDCGNLTNFKGNPLKPRAISSSIKSLGFEKSVPKKIDGKTKRCIPLKTQHLNTLFARYGVTKVTKVTQYTESLAKTEKSPFSSKSDIFNKNVALPMHRNLRNSVTEEILDFEELLDPSFQKCNTCPKTQCNIYNSKLDKYFCSESCMKAYVVNNNPKQDGDV